MAESEALAAKERSVNESIQALVRADLEKREELGIERYGTSLRPHNGRDALQDAYEEALDLACYLKQARVERAEPPVEKVLDVAELIADDRDEWRAKCEAAERTSAVWHDRYDARESEAASLRADVKALTEDNIKMQAMVGEAQTEAAELREGLETVRALIEERKHPRYGPGYGGIYVSELEALLANAPAVPTRTDEEAKK